MYDSILSLQSAPRDEWAKILFGTHLWSRQVEILEACRTHDRVAVKAAHGVGKSFIAGLIAIQFMLDAAESGGGMLITTAPTAAQVDDIIWKELRRSFNRARDLGFDISSRPPNPGTPRWSMFADEPEYCFAKGMSTDDPGNFQGYHDRTLAVIVDEAAEVQPWLWGQVTALQPNLVVAMGNPTDPESPFKDFFDNPNWKTFSVPVWDSPNFTGEADHLPEEATRSLVNQEWVDALEAEGRGPGTMYWISRVEAKFPDVGEAALMPGSWYDEVLVSEAPAPRQRSAGVDIAEFGGDQSIVTIWHDNYLIDIIHIPQGDLMETTGRISQVLKQHFVTLAAVDDTGLCGVASRLRELGHGVLAVSFGAGADEPERYANRRAEMAWHFREAVRNKEIFFAKPSLQLREEGRKTRYKYTSAGKVQLEAKAEIKKRIKRSPDTYDACMLGLEAVRKGHIVDLSEVAFFGTPRAGRGQSARALR